MARAAALFWVFPFTLIVLAIGFAPLRAQQPTPADPDIAPPLELVVPAGPEEIPPPRQDPRDPISPSDLPRVVPAEPSGSPLLPGMFVEGGVELYPHVEVEDADEIHPRAVPMIIAVVDPRYSLPRHGLLRHRNRVAVGPPPLVFVQVFVPPKPPQSVRVKREEVDLFYGGRKINIDSEDGVVKIDYE